MVTKMTLAEYKTLAKKKPKYKAVPTTIGKIRFSSGLEATRYKQLRLLEKDGQVQFFLLQPRFELPGGTKYVSDFLIVWADGSITVEDIKGFQTQKFKMQKKQVEALYPIEINLLMKGDF